MISAVRAYGEGLRSGADAGSASYARLSDGTVFRLPLERWLGRADATDEQLLRGLEGPVLDVGCGPGRHLRALAVRGVFALGVDLSPVAVGLATGAGCRAIVGDIFAELPGCGSWRSALLLDGNVGIGGAPVRLLARIGALLAANGEVLVEVESPAGSTCSARARIERDGAASAWFPWARVAAPAIEEIARLAGFDVSETWSLRGRWFVRLKQTAAESVAHCDSETPA